MAVFRVSDSWKYSMMMSAVHRSTRQTIHTMNHGSLLLAENMTTERPSGSASSSTKPTRMRCG